MERDDSGQSGGSPEESADAAEVDPCGCVPRPAGTGAPTDAREAGVEPTGQDEASPTPTDAGPRRELKLVVLLRPSGAGFQARLAAGAAGCDPELRVVDVPDLPTALRALIELATAAEARWRVRRRYPSAPPRRSACAGAT
jgi:hypothetical protein